MAVQSKDWQKPEIKEGKQAEFLVEDSFSWQLIEKVGVYSEHMQEKVETILSKQKQKLQPQVMRIPDWYY